MVKQGQKAEGNCLHCSKNGLGEYHNIHYANEDINWHSDIQFSTTLKYLGSTDIFICDNCVDLIYTKNIEHNDKIETIEAFFTGLCILTVCSLFIYESFSLKWPWYEYIFGFVFSVVIALFPAVFASFMIKTIFRVKELDKRKIAESIAWQSFGPIIQQDYKDLPITKVNPETFELAND